MGIIKKYILIFLIGVVLLIVGIVVFYFCFLIFFVRTLGNSGSMPGPEYTIFGFPPELITCIAGLITAITGLILALYQIIHLRLSEKSRHERKKNSLTDDQLEGSVAKNIC